MSARSAPLGTAAPASRARVRARAGARTIGHILVEDGHLSDADLARALALQKRQNLRLGEILLAHGMVGERVLTATIARQYGALPVDLGTFPPDPRLIDEMGVETCLAEEAVPVRRLAGATVLATARPEAFEDLAARLPASFATPVMAFAATRDIHAAIVSARGPRLAGKAARRCPAAESCRGFGPVRPQAMLALLLTVAVLALLVPGGLVAALLAWALLTLTAGTALKVAAALAALRRPPPEAPAEIGALPVVSVIVPLFQEADIAERLIARLARVNYPKELLDICLVTEADDTTTRAMLAATDLPFWMRVIAVPGGGPRTKPRALNFALDFCRGSIVGVWDAEDAPAPDQIHRVVRRFATAPGDVACLQGVLDFYNAGRNWLSRCFAAEYAGWFRVMLPGLARLGLVMPLGGTTLFFRRAALEALGGWDAHNVTEDADLGVRLARHGWRTELIPTVTEEEANCRPWPWVRQRTRWVKGYAMTWAVHMRRPARLWRDLGGVRFLGLQVLFLGTLSQFLLAPAMWAIWLWRPASGAAAATALIFVLAEAVNLAVALAGLRRAGKSRLWWVALTLPLYFPLAVLAAYRALFGIASRPFHWEKTAHGAYHAAGPEAGGDETGATD